MFTLCHPNPENRSRPLGVWYGLVCGIQNSARCVVSYGMILYGTQYEVWYGMVFGML